MTDRPIPFVAAMIRALLDGRKTMTRRVVKVDKIRPSRWDHDSIGLIKVIKDARWRARTRSFNVWSKPFDLGYAPSDRLWVRESYYQFGHWEPVETKRTRAGRLKWRFVADRSDVLFEPPEGEPVRLGRHHRDPATPAWHKRLARFMPRAFSRLTLIVEDVRVERLQEISEADARAEGVERLSDWEGVERFKHYGCDELAIPYPGAAAKISFSTLWDSINGDDAWAANPWVAAISFRVIRANIDSKEAKAA